MVHPLLVEREEKNVLVIVVAGDKGFAGAFNSNISKAAQGFIDERRAMGQNVDVEPVGTQGVAISSASAIRRPCTRRKKSITTTIWRRTTRRFGIAAHPVEVTGEHQTMLLKLDFDEVSAMSHSIVERYERAEIDSVYIVYNEFKSVISQRLVVEKLLPIRKLGSHEITASEEMTEEQKEAAGRAAQSRRR